MTRTVGRPCSISPLLTALPPLPCVLLLQPPLPSLLPRGATPTVPPEEVWVAIPLLRGLVDRGLPTGGLPADATSLCVLHSLQSSIIIFTPRPNAHHTKVAHTPQITQSITSPPPTGNQTRGGSWGCYSPTSEASFAFLLAFGVGDGEELGG